MVFTSELENSSPSEVSAVMGLAFSLSVSHFVTWEARARSGGCSEHRVCGERVLAVMLPGSMPLI